MKNNYLIVGIGEDGHFKRHCVRNVSSKIDAFKDFYDFFKNAQIISAIELNEEAAEWIIKNNMPNCQNL